MITRIRTWRRRAAIIAKVAEIDALFEEIERAAPCSGSDPGCIDFRRRMRKVVEKDHGVHEHATA